jgi:head-tail adaptor
MIAGRMRNMLKVFKPDTTTDQYGSTVVSYAEVGTIHAERSKADGNTVAEAAEAFAAYTATYNVRDCHGIKAGWRVEELGGELYNVLAVVGNPGKGMATLKCERVNL